MQSMARLYNGNAFLRVFLKRLIDPLSVCPVVTLAALPLDVEFNAFF